MNVQKFEPETFLWFFVSILIIVHWVIVFLSYLCICIDYLPTWIIWALFNLCGCNFALVSSLLVIWWKLHFVVCFCRMQNPTPIDTSDNISKSKSDNIGWEYSELVDPGNSQKMKCKLCNRILTGGVFRLKQHVAHIKGNVVSCDKSTPIDQKKCKRALDEVKTMKET